MPLSDKKARLMHPVQAAPRQSSAYPLKDALTKDAPRAGSAEAKCKRRITAGASTRCTPCRQRRGKEMMQVYNVVAAQDAPRAGSAEAKF